MAKKKSNSTNGPKRGVKTAAILDYLKSNRDAKPKQVVEALKGQGIDVSPNMVSITKAKAGIRKVRRSAAAAVASQDKTAAAQTSKSAGLEAALLLYKAARGQSVPAKQVSSAFLTVVEMLS